MFDIADVILLVDNAVQPMQYSSLTALKRVVASGYTDQLTIAFTHFDQVEEDNFENIYDKKRYVYNSLRNGLSEIEKNIGSFMIERLENELERRCLFLENLNNKDSELKDSTKKQLNDLFRNDETIISSISVTDIVFDVYLGKWNYRAIPKVKTWSYFLTIP
jgi:hypothetical protein